MSSPPNITYLTGYDMVWYYLTSPVSVAVQPIPGRPFSSRSPGPSSGAVVDDAEYGDGQSPAEHIVTLKGRGWLKGKSEDWSRAPSGVVINEIKQGFADAGANVGRLVGRGPGQVDQVRAGDRGDEEGRLHSGAMETVRGSIRPGVMETELAGVALHAMMKEGGGDPAIRAAVRSGPRFAARHSAPSHRKLQQGDLV